MYFEEKFNIYSQIILIAKEILSQIFSLKSMRKKKTNNAVSFPQFTQ